MELKMENMFEIKHDSLRAEKRRRYTSNPKTNTW